MQNYTQQVFTRITVRQQKQVKRLCKRAEMSPSEFIRNAIKEKIVREQLQLPALKPRNRYLKVNFTPE